MRFFLLFAAAVARVASAETERPGPPRRPPAGTSKPKHHRHAPSRNVPSGGDRPHVQHGPRGHRVGAPPRNVSTPVGDGRHGPRGRAPARNVSTPFGPADASAGASPSDAFLKSHDIRLGDCATLAKQRSSPGVSERQGNRWWVLVRDDYVVKAFGNSYAKEYAKERDITRTLSKYPHFVKLLAHDDACQALYLENLGRDDSRLKQYAGNPNLNETSVRRQLDYIFAVLDKERITPSTELFNGRNNLIVDRAGTITFFDFGAYVSGNRTSRSSQSRGYDAKINNAIKECLAFTWRRRLDVTWRDCLDVSPANSGWSRAREMSPETRIGTRRI